MECDLVYSIKDCQRCLFPKRCNFLPFSALNTFELKHVCTVLKMFTSWCFPFKSSRGGEGETHISISTIAIPLLLFSHAASLSQSCVCFYYSIGLSIYPAVSQSSLKHVSTVYSAVKKGFL